MLDGELPVSEQTHQSDSSELYRDKVYPDVSDSGFGPLSLHSDWDPNVGYAVYNAWAQEMTTLKLKKRLKSAKEVLLPVVAVLVVLWLIKFAAKRFRLQAPLLRWGNRFNIKFRTVTRSPAEYKPKSFKFHG